MSKPPRVPKGRVCRTPGAFFYYNARRSGAQTWLEFHVSVPTFVAMQLTEHRVKRMENMFHDNMELLLSPIWKEPKVEPVPASTTSTFLRMPK